MIVFSCAQIVPLSGGDQDLEPPKELGSIPGNGSLHFTGNEITIEFDEFIQLQNLQSQLIVSPLMDEKPEITVKGKKLVISLPDSLRENTTYSLNFGEAITDITENNPVPNYKYVFSTGDYLDSLSYSGSVVNAFDLTPPEKMVVLLYDQLEDSVPYLSRPRYVAITDKEGKFSIGNMAAGTYKVFAINDINGNYLFDLPNEQIAFLKEPVQVNQNQNNAVLEVFEEESKQQFVLKSENKEYSKISMILNNPAEGIELQVLSENVPADSWLLEKNKTEDSLTLWLTRPLGIDRLELELRDREKVIDTLDISLLSDKKWDEKSLPVLTNCSKIFDLNKALQIRSGRPVKVAHPELIQLFEDSTAVSIDVRSVNELNSVFQLNYSFKEQTRYKLMIPKGTFRDHFGLYNDTIQVDFTSKASSDYGTIALTVEPNFNENYIVQLYKNKQRVEQQFLQGQAAINYKYLKPGNYELKLIVDSNNDKKWTTGQYLEHRQPEKVYYYEKQIVLKANWDNEINWIIKD